MSKEKLTPEEELERACHKINNYYGDEKPPADVIKDIVQEYAEQYHKQQIEIEMEELKNRWTPPRESNKKEK